MDSNTNYIKKKYASKNQKFKDIDYYYDYYNNDNNISITKKSTLVVCQIEQFSLIDMKEIEFINEEIPKINPSLVLNLIQLSTNSNINNINNNSDIKDLSSQQSSIKDIIKYDYVENQDHYLCCEICCCILHEPVECYRCESSICKNCYIFLGSNKKCPFCCYQRFKVKSNKLLRNLLSELQIYCPTPGCEVIVSYGEFITHFNYCKRKTEKIKKRKKNKEVLISLNELNKLTEQKKQMSKLELINELEKKDEFVTLYYNEKNKLELVIKDKNKELEKKNKELEKKNKELEKELARKDKALAEMAALITLKKKAEAIWGEEDQ